MPKTLPIPAEALRSATHSHFAATDTTYREEWITLCAAYEDEDHGLYCALVMTRRAAKSDRAFQRARHRYEEAKALALFQLHEALDGARADAFRRLVEGPSK